MTDTESAGTREITALDAQFVGKTNAAAKKALSDAAARRQWAVTRYGSPLITILLCEEIARLNLVQADLMKAFEAAERICKSALPKFDWGKSALDAEAVTALNEGMLTIERVRAALSSQVQP